MRFDRTQSGLIRQPSGRTTARVLPYLALRADSRWGLSRYSHCPFSTTEWFSPSAHA